MQQNIEQRVEYATDKARRTKRGVSLVKLPGQKGFAETRDSAELIAKRIQIDVRERRLKEAERNGR